MKLPLNWLSEYVDISGLDPKEIAERLTMGAFEVEDIKKIGPDIKGPIVVGQILEINPHPNATKIRLTSVKVAEGEAPLSIVCGAQNIEVGQIIPVALPGARVVNRHDGTPLPIGVTTIRGVTSNGMLCSSSELGLPFTNVDGIYIFEPGSKYKLGQDVLDALELEIDHVLTVEPRSNRGDALSILGLAREVAALFQRPVIEPKWQLPSKVSSEKSKYALTIEDTADCDFFSIRSFHNIVVAESPHHIKRRLESIGMRPVNNVVDITNYVMHELGQPLHAYDADAIVGGAFSVRRAHSGEKVKTLDGKERALDPEVLVITDRQNVVGVAGIMGGLDSEVGNKTTNIALEAASFKAARVRRGTRLLGMSTDGSLRWERGVDVNSTVKASDRATFLIHQHCGGNVEIASFSQTGAVKQKSANISFRVSQIKRLLDIDLKAEQVVEILKPLGFAIKNHEILSSKENGPTLEISVPSFRQQDVQREIDLIEEVARIYGYDRVPSAMPYNTIVAPPQSNTLNLIRQALCAQGLSEAYITSLVPRESGESESSEASSTNFNFATQDKNTLIEVLKPLSPDHQVLRQSLLPGLIKAAHFNRDRGEKNVWLFEIGRIYLSKTSPDGQNKKISGSSANDSSVVHEPLKVAAILAGERKMSHWRDQRMHTINGDTAPSVSKESGPDFYDTKGIIENLFAHLKIDKHHVRFEQVADMPAVLHPTKSARLVTSCTSDAGQDTQGQLLGWLGAIHPYCAKTMGLDEATFLFQIDVAILDALQKPSAFDAIANSPVIERDLTVDLPKLIDSAAVYSTICAAAGQYFRNLDLVSVFELNSDLRSLSYRLRFQDPDKTLRNEDVEKSLHNVREALTKKLGASFRSTIG